ncbi:MAG: hypothetical protein MJZ78_05210 [Bacteroidales bacterium]|nr:hypothetical protein [Bacteroidales bacterium]
MDKKIGKLGYEAPRIEAAGFVTENGYAASGAPQQSVTAKISLGVGGL